MLVPVLAAPLLGAAWPDLSQSTPVGPGAPGDAALIVSISDYLVLEDVPGADLNARDWQRWFEDRQVPYVKALWDKEATLETLREEARTAASRASPGGTLWFVFIGHGAPGPDGSGYLVGADAQQTPTQFYSRSLRRDDLTALLETGSQAHTVLVLDTCFSGLTPSGAKAMPEGQSVLLTGTWRPPRSTVLTAGRSDQFAGPLPGEMRPAFTYLVLGGLRGWADGNGDGAITAREVTRYADDTLLQTLPGGRRQSPEVFGAEPDLILSRPVSPEARPDLSAVRTRRAPKAAARMEPRLSTPFLVAAGTSAVVAGGLYAGAWLSHGAWKDQSSTCVTGGCGDDGASTLQDLKDRTNALTLASAGAGALTLGFGVLSIRW